jgi:hypothetical protein
MRAVPSGDQEKARGMVNVPGILLMVHGGLSILAYLGTILFCIATATANSTDKDSVPGLIFGACCNGLGIPLDGLDIFGGLKLRSLNS